MVELSWSELEIKLIESKKHKKTDYGSGKIRSANRYLLIKILKEISAICSGEELCQSVLETKLKTDYNNLGSCVTSNEYSKSLRSKVNRGTLRESQKRVSGSKWLRNRSKEDRAIKQRATHFRIWTCTKPRVDVWRRRYLV